jgi:teichoic acid transport system permease protein
VGRFSGPVLTLIKLNPKYSMIGGYTELLQNDAFPPTYLWISAVAWALASALSGDRAIWLPGTLQRRRTP